MSESTDWVQKFRESAAQGIESWGAEGSGGNDPSIAALLPAGTEVVVDIRNGGGRLSIWTYFGGDFKRLSELDEAQRVYLCGVLAKVYAAVRVGGGNGPA